MTNGIQQISDDFGDCYVNYLVQCTTRLIGKRNTVDFGVIFGKMVIFLAPPGRLALNFEIGCVQ